MTAQFSGNCDDLDTSFQEGIECTGEVPGAGIEPLKASRWRSSTSARDEAGDIVSATPTFAG